MERLWWAEGRWRCGKEEWVGSDWSGIRAKGGSLLPELCVWEAYDGAAKQWFDAPKVRCVSESAIAAELEQAESKVATRSERNMMIVAGLRLTVTSAGEY